MNKSTYFKYESVPSALSKELQEELLHRLALGDQVARNKLIIHNIRLVIYELYNKFNNVLIEMDDLISIGVYGLIKGIDTFDMSRGAKFSTYVMRCIDNEILMIIRKQNYHSRHTIDNVDLSTLVDYSININDEYEEKEEKEMIGKLLNQLHKKAQLVMKLHFGFFNDHCYTQTEIAQMLGLSQSYISRIINRNLAIVKNLMNNYISDDINEEHDKIKTINY